jgi:hypothetical protein
MPFPRRERQECDEHRDRRRNARLGVLRLGQHRFPAPTEGAFQRGCALVGWLVVLIIVLAAIGLLAVIRGVAAKR